MEDAWDRLLVLDFEAHLSGRSQVSCMVWGVHPAYPRAELPRGPSASPAPQEMGRAGGLQGLHTRSCCHSVHQQNQANATTLSLLSKEGERPRQQRPATLARVEAGDRAARWDRAVNLRKRPARCI